MLVEFQQALADLVASPGLCRAVAETPDLLRERYTLTDLEYRRLATMATHPGMTSNCVLYRANRLAPLVLNLPDLCRALGPDLKQLLTEFWESSPNASGNFLTECDNFCCFIERKELEGYVLAEAARRAFEREAGAVSLRLDAVRTVL